MTDLASGASFNLRIPGYAVGARCWEDQVSITFKAERLDDRQQVLIRLSKPYQAHAFAIDAKRNQEVTRNLDPACVMKPLAIGKTASCDYEILPDPGIQPLSDLVLFAGPLEVEPILVLTLSMALALDQIHSAGIIHGNLNPNCIWSDASLKHVWLSDFSRSVRITEASRSSGIAPPLDFRFIAPEQTGPYTTSMDSRADLYAVGAIAYSLLCGTAPLQETSHSERTGPPPAPRRIRGDVPEGLSALVMKLLAHAPDERYQTAKGVVNDLTHCLDTLRTSGDVLSFALGARDSVPGFEIPDELVGREAEILQLRDALARVRSGAFELLLISGPAGIGKSTLTSALKPHALKGGTYAAGKFDQFRPNEPYSVIIQAFRSVVHQMISGGQPQFDAWKDALRESIGPNAALLTSLIPELAVLLGPQTPLCDLPAVEELSRFHWVFRSFVKAIARPDHSLCVFLDDLQWADTGSVHLINQLLQDRLITNVLVVIAFRSTELAASAELAELASQLRHAPVPVTEIALDGLAPRDVREIVFSAFCNRNEREALLAEELQHRCSGNPFYIKQLLRSLHQEGAIAYSYSSGAWEYNKAALEKLIPADLVQLVAERMQLLSTFTREILSIAACLGSNFTLDDLHLVTRRDRNLIEKAIKEAREQGMIVQSGPADRGPSGFQFMHDRIQQEAYERIPKDDRAKVRLEIGIAFLKSYEPAQRHLVPFFVVDNLNAGASAGIDASLRAEVAELNLIAGSRAKDRAAYSAAFQYFSYSAKFLQEDSWQHAYELTLNVYMEYFECAYMTGAVEEASALFNTIVSRTNSKRDVARAYCVAILLHSGLDRTDDAVELGLKALKDYFGQDLPREPSRVRLARELIGVVALLRGRRAGDLLGLPANTSENQISTIRLLMSICPAAYFRNPDLMSLAALRIMIISLRYGNTSESAYGYVLYGLTLGALFGSFQRGDDFGRLAVEIAQRYGTASEQCKILLIYAGFVAFWRRPFAECTEILRKALRLATESGDIQYAHYSILQLIFLQLASGQKLSLILNEISHHEESLGQNRDWFSQSSYRVRRQFILALAGRTRSFIELSDNDYDEDAVVNELRAAGNLTSFAYYLVAKTQLLFIFGEYEAALSYSNEAEKQLKCIQNQVSLAEHLLFRGLAASVMAQERDAHGGTYWETVRRCARKVRAFARNCPENFECLHLLLDAQLASHTAPGEAEALFDKAIEAARRGTHPNIEAIANELAAKYFLRASRVSVARNFLVAAYRAYLQWGASAKAQQLLETFSSHGLAELLWDNVEVRTRAREEQPDESLRLGAMLQGGAGIAAADISPMEILRRQIAHLRVAAGGSRAALLRREADTNTVQMQDPEPLNGSDDGFSEVVVNFVTRTGTRVVSRNVLQDVRFSGCAYLSSRSPDIGIVCLPLYRQGRIIGSVYVEQSGSHKDLSPQHVHILEMLVSQVAVSLENVDLAGTLVANDERLAVALRDVDALRRTRSRLDLFVPDDLKALIESSDGTDALGPHILDLTIMFVDMAGYTSLSESVSPDRLRAIVQTYFSRFLSEIHKHGGDLNTFAGDGLMVTFQHTSRKEHARRAVLTALGIRRETELQNLEAEGRWPAARFNTGIHSGEALMGATKLESPTGARWVYTATGFSANLASRIGGAAREGQILISGETASRTEGLFSVVSKGALEFKGVSKPTDVVEVLDLLGSA